VLDFSISPIHPPLGDFQLVSELKLLIMHMMARVIFAIFYNSLHWSRSCCNIWNMGWSESAI